MTSPLPAFSNPALGALKGAVDVVEDAAKSEVAARLMFARMPVDVGALGDGVADDTAALQKLFAVGGYLPVPPGGFYKVTGTLYPAAGVTLRGNGASSLIKLVLPVGAPAVPVIEVKSTSPSVVLESFAVDGGFNPGGAAPALSAPTIYGGDPIAGSAIILGGDRSVARNLSVMNAWDNGISILSKDSATQPALVEVSAISGYKNGYGSGGGACVDNAGGVAATVRDCFDLGSMVGFISDIGAGAHGVLTNLISRGAITLGFYVGSAQVDASNLYTEFSGGDGFWIDAANQNTKDDQGRITSFSRSNYTNLYAYCPKKRGFLIGGGKLHVLNALVTAAWFGATGANKGRYAYEVHSPTSIYEIMLVNCANDGNDAGTVEYGFGETPENGASIETTIIGGAGFNGTAGGVQPGTGIGKLVLPGALQVGGRGSDPGITVLRAGDDTPVYISSGKLYSTDAYITATGPGGPGFVMYSTGGDVSLRTSGGTSVRAYVNGDAALGYPNPGGLPANAGSGFGYIADTAGPPTGTPTARDGLTPITVDIKNSKLWLFLNGAWKGVALQ